MRIIFPKVIYEHLIGEKLESGSGNESCLSVKKDLFVH
ncbi:hypothetical protein MAMMFC1_04211 [Methylomusa anaerophila]|uniref:Uncharacterized protein n=1 Tax=Methylomusa anaerophila TaxID=1930071 RepID=A0A348AQZ6_9FIRM|nr:hypothetical protein MAMMFC1_04211 [Methylomusa anaerophila]